MLYGEMIMRNEKGEFTGIFRAKRTSDVTGVSIAGIYAKMDPKSESHDPSFPRPVRLGAKAVGWKAEEILAWIDSLPRA